MAKLSKLEENNNFMINLIKSGVEQCFKTELPHPKCASRSKANGPVLAINGNVIYFKTEES